MSKTQTIDLTPNAREQENLLGLFTGSILSDVRKARRDADVELLRGVVNLAFTIGFNTRGLVTDPESLEDVQGLAVDTRERLMSRIA